MKKILILVALIATLAQAEIVGTTQVGISILSDSSKALSAKQNLGVKFGIIEATGYAMIDKSYDRIPYDKLTKAISYGGDLNIVNELQDGFGLYFGGGYGEGELRDNVDAKFKDYAFRCGAIQDGGVIDVRYTLEIKQRKYENLNESESQFGAFIALSY